MSRLPIPVPVHEAAELFPLLEGEEYERLKADIKEHGIQVWMTFYDGKLIDGRNRYRACMELGINPDHYSEELDKDLVEDPVAWVLSVNLHRTHLSETQRETIAAKIANMKEGRPSKETPPNGGVSTKDAASFLNVKPRSVERAKAAIKGGCTELVEAMERDEITVSQAEQFVKAVPDKAEQSKIVGEGKKAVADAIKKVSKPKPAPKPDPPKPSKPTKGKKTGRVRKRVPEVVIVLRRSESRMNDLRSILDELEPHELQTLISMASEKAKEGDK